MPIVSVIIPTHNRAELLRTAISSVIDQTFKDWEVIIVDDHCTDHTQSVFESIVDERIRYLQNKGKNGPSVARNLGIKAARGKYIAFLDDDDKWLPHKLEMQMTVINSCPKKVGGIYSNRMLINKMTGEIYSNEPGAEILKGNLLTQLLIKNPIHTSTLVIRKTCLDQVGFFDETMRYMEDRDLWIRFAMKWEFEYIDAPLTKAYFHGEEHLSRNLEGQIKGRELLLQRYSHLFKKQKKSLSKLNITLGAQYCQLGKMKQGRQKLITGLKIYPFNKLAFLHFCTSLLGSTNYQRIRKVFKITKLDS